MNLHQRISDYIKLQKFLNKKTVDEQKLVDTFIKNKIEEEHKFVVYKNDLLRDFTEKTKLDLKNEIKILEKDTQQQLIDTVTEHLSRAKEQIGQLIEGSIKQAKKELTQDFQLALKALTAQITQSFNIPKKVDFSLPEEYAYSQGMHKNLGEYIHEMENDLRIEQENHTKDISK